MISAVLQTSFLGDMVLTTPLITRLARDGPVHVVATPATAGLLSNHPAVSSVIVYDKRGADRGWTGLRRVAERLSSVRADRACLAQGSVRTALLASLAGIPVRTGFDTSPGRILCTRRVRYRKDLHHARRLLSLAIEMPDGAHASGFDNTGSPDEQVVSRPSLYPGLSETQAVADLLNTGDLGCPPGTPLIALAPGSVWATKRWPFYGELASLLQVRLGKRLPGLRFAVIGAESDSVHADEIAERVRAVDGLPVVNATGRLSLLASAALLSEAIVAVTNDSAPLHLASAVNTPTVAIFGPTSTSFGFGPLADRSMALGQALSCRPCDPHGPHNCPLGHWNCMRTLSAESVAEAVARVIFPDAAYLS